MSNKQEGQSFPIARNYFVSSSAIRRVRLSLECLSMPISVRSFAKINVGLCIGASRSDGFHDLRTVYQTIALHDIIRVKVVSGSGIEIRSEDPRVPKDETNTCWRIAERAVAALRVKGRVVIEIEKKLPVQGGLGGGSANAVAALLGLERAVKKLLLGAERLRMAATVGSDLPLFLIGGTCLGVGRGEEVYPLPDLPRTPCVIATPEVAVSTPKAFADWDSMMCPQGLKPDPFAGSICTPEAVPYPKSEEISQKLTALNPSDRMNEFGRRLSAWLSGGSQSKTGKASSGVSARGGGRAENPLLDFVRTGIENDFERVVFPKYPDLREVKRVLEGAGAIYASLSGSGSAVYGLFASRTAAEKAAGKLRKNGVPAAVTATLTRPQYWKKIFD
jgi:4-diphosphocytidyl-2-C-methyl-D-erythritol kinase